MNRSKKDVARMSEAREIMLALLENDEASKEWLQVTIQGVLEAERDEALGAGRSGRTSGRRGYGSGCYSGNLATRVGALELAGLKRTTLATPGVSSSRS